MLQAIDTHCHLNLEPLYSGKPGFFNSKQTKPLADKNWQNHWSKAQEKGVVGAIVVGADYENSLKALKIAENNKQLKAAIGIHPEIISRQFSDSKDELKANNGSLPLTVLKQLAKLKKIAKKDKSLAAVGETGLDYFHLKKHSSEIKQQIINLQKKLFIKHIELANQLDKPLIVHTRDRNQQVYEDVLTLIRENFDFKKPFILHCISGPLNYIDQALDLDAYISAAGNVTYPSADHLREIVKRVPQNKLLVETDAPFLAPEPHRGKINQPYMVMNTIKFLKEHFAVDSNQLLANSRQVFY